MIEKKILRDIFKLFLSLVFSWLYIPHLIIFIFSKRKEHIRKDCEANITDSFQLNSIMSLLFLLHNNKFFRVLFYYRIGPLLSLIIGWYRPGGGEFTISPLSQIGAGVRLYHPYSTIIYADKIGTNFGIAQCCTLGKKNGMRPIVGDNVTICPGSIIIGGIKIGDNSIIGAGSIVVKDIPNHCIAAGNPAKVLKHNI